MELFNKVQKIIADQLGIEPDTIKLESKIDSLGSDSLDLVEIIMKIEDEFNIEINDADAEKLTTVQETVDYIAKLIK